MARRSECFQDRPPWLKKFTDDIQSPDIHHVPKIQITEFLREFVLGKPLVFSTKNPR